MRSNSATHAPHSFLGDQERFEVSTGTRITEKYFQFLLGYVYPSTAEKRSESYCLDDKLEDH